MHAYFGNCQLLQMTLAQAQSAAHPGECVEDVRALCAAPNIRRQLAKISPEDIRRELREMSGWDDTELADDAANLERFVWIMASQIVEENRSRRV